ncbi:MAG: Sir2 family NAD-dependent protein deacetylase [Evtepia sp.]|uniref:SIR2 family NAD-dependent protein deacylase n=1 Tax=Evtepia sp. TaxID=2773933 RepID=UPI002A75BFE0|nr:Sir2 family NAD-dependent protein deacetylase [Evtepia sp.]MDY3015099.1 Sir2 family NAD-dependent protein deacetylase [Evtepia sp.]
MDIQYHILQKWINQSDRIVFISGAAFSEAAGFPDYRVMDETFLETYKYPPEEMLCLTFLQRYPAFFYRYYRNKILAPLLEARPGVAHDTLVKLEEAGKLKAILTVNIDGIHQEAGSRNVLELHGSVMRSWCAKCEKFMDFFYIADSPSLIPYCNVDMCGDYVRPAIVLKEEPYDLALLEQAMQAVREADVLIIDGSALKEFPVPNLMAAYQGHKLVLMNTAPLVFDARAGVVIRGDYNEIFSQLELDL